MTEPETKCESEDNEIGIFKLASQSVEDIFFIVDKDRSVRFTNGKHKSPAILSNFRPFDRLVCADILEALGQSIESVFESGRALSATCRLGEPGRELWLHNLLTPISDESGKVSSILGIARDISEERLLKVSTCVPSSFQSDISGRPFLVTTSPLADPEGNITGCLFVAVSLNERADDEKNRNKTMAQMKTLFGQAEYVVTIQDPGGKYLSMKALPGNIQFPEAIMGKTPFDFFDHASASRIREGAMRAIRVGRDITVPNELKLGGKTFHLLDHISPVSDESGNISLVVTISKSIDWAPEKISPVRNESRGLSTRELEVLRLIGSGLTTSQIAGKLFISRKTVETHRARIMQKLGLHKSPALVQYAIKSGLF